MIVNSIGKSLRIFIISIILTCLTVITGIAQSGTLTKGSEWLEAQQNADGSWNTGDKQITDTAEAFETLLYLGKTGENINRTLNHAASKNPENTVEISRILSILSRSSGTDTTSLRQKLLLNQNTDGGFGLTKGYESNPLITFLAVKALISCGTANTSEIEQGINYLASCQEESGNWKLQGDYSAYTENPDLFLSGLILIAVRQYQVDNGYFPDNVCSMISKASQFIENSRNPGGFWGEPDGDVNLTSLALAGLIRTSKPQSLSDSVAWLEGQQDTSGSFGNDIYSTALALRALRDWEISPVPEPPDIEITAADIVFTPSTPAASDQILFTVTVKNIGESEATNVGVQFYDGDPVTGGMKIGDEFKLNKISPASYGTVRLGAYLLSGNHEIHVVADPGNMVIESNKNNNSAMVSVPVTAVQETPSDFQVLSTNIEFSNPSPTNLDPVTIGAMIKNIGETTAKSLIVAVYDGVPGNGGTQIGDDILFNNLSGGGDATVSLRTMLTSGTHEIYIKADPYNNIAESDETNNIASRTLNVTESPSAPCDLEIKKGSLSVSNSTPTAAEKITFTVRVDNNGGINASDVKLRFYDGAPDQGGKQIGSDLLFSGIAAGGQGEGKLEITLAAGNHRVYAFVDPVNTIIESNESNNTAYIELDVQPVPLPDLTIAGITIPPDEFHAGDRVELTVAISNPGPGPANAAEIRLYQGIPGNGGIPVSADIGIPLIASGETVTVAIAWCAAVGEHDVYAVLDPDQLIPEQDEYNNSSSVTINVLPGETPPPVSDPEIQEAINKGIAWLKTRQQPNGSWPDYGYGEAALALLTLLHSGLDETDPVVANGFSYLDTYDGHREYSTYTISLVIMAYHATGDKSKYYDRVNSLFLTLLKNHFYAVWYFEYNGQEYWDYWFEPIFDYGDMSNSQYGWLGIYAAQQWGMEFPPPSWGNIDTIKQWWLSWMKDFQLADGGYNYRPWQGGSSYGSMTAAGVMILRILGAPDDDPAVQNGINWLNSHFTVTTNPGSGSWNYYYLYSLERAMSIPSLIPAVGTHDWYMEGAAYLIGQQEEDGRWIDNSMGTWSRDELATCFALLFLERAVPEASDCDLIVKNITFSETQPVQGENITVTATIQNDDVMDIETPFKVSFYDGVPDNGGQKINGDVEIAGLANGISTDITVNWTPAHSGTHSIYVTADIYNEVDERHEDNNTKISEINVLSLSGFEINVQNDKQTYLTDEILTATITVKNTGQNPATGTVPVSIRDADNAVITELSLEYLPELTPDGTHTFERKWRITAGTPTGKYRTTASVLVDDIKAASNYAVFDVESQFGISSSIKTDKTGYPAHADVTVISKVTSESSNHTYTGLTVDVKINDPENTVVFDKNYIIGELAPERIDQRKLIWNTGISTPGVYTVTQKVYENGTSELCAASTTFMIISSLNSGGFAGKISTVPNTVEGGNTFNITYEITNTGNEDIVNAELIKIVNSRLTQSNELNLTETLNLAKGEKYENTISNISTNSFFVHKFLVVLRLKTESGKEHTVASTYLNVVDTVPPTITDTLPVNGTTIADNTPQISAVLADNYSGIDASTVAVKIDDNALSAAFDENTGQVTATPAAALTDGWHNVSITVKDKAGNTATTPEWKIGIDVTAPEIANQTPLPDTVISETKPEISVILSDNFSGIKEDSISMTLDGNAVTAAFDADTGKLSFIPADDLTDGWHNVMVSVKDNVENESTAAWKFGVDITPPVIANQTPVPDVIITNNQPEISVTLTDNFSGIKEDSISMTLDGNAVTASFDAGTGKLSFTPPAALTDGWSNVSVTVKDNVGNESTATWKFGVDVTPPTITALQPEPGSIVNENQPEISAVLADNFSGVDPATITLTIGETAVPFTYDENTGKVTGTPAQQLQDGDYTIVLTVKDKVGNSATTEGWTIKIQTWVIFHNSSSGRLDISGTNKDIQGRIHSNADIRIRGSNNDVSEKASAVGTINISGSKHDLPEQAPGSSPEPIPVYDFTYYQNNAAHTHQGTWHIKGNDTIPDGIHYVDGDVKITGHNITGNVVIVATGDIRITGKSPNLTSSDAENHMLLFSRDGDIHISGNTAVLKGIIYAPQGDAHITSSGETIEGAVIADTVDISGSGITFLRWGQSGE